MASEFVASSLRKRVLAPRGWLVRVTNLKKLERWFAVGIYSQKVADTAVCRLRQIEPTDVVFAHRRLMPTEIEKLGLEREQVILCSFIDEVLVPGEVWQALPVPVEIASNSAETRPLSDGNSKKNCGRLVMQEPRLEVSIELRDLASQTIDQAEAAFGFFFDAAKKSLVSIPRPAMALSEHALSFIEQNVRAAFDNARKVVRATNPQEVMQFQSEFLKGQFTRAGEHVRKITCEAAAGKVSRGKVKKL